MTSGTERKAPPPLESLQLQSWLTILRAGEELEEEELASHCSGWHHAARSKGILLSA